MAKWARGRHGYTVENCGSRPDCCPLHANATDLLAALERAADTSDTVKAMMMLQRHTVAEAMRIAENDTRATIRRARGES